MNSQTKYTESDYSAITKYLLREDPTSRPVGSNYFACISLFDTAEKHPFVSDLDQKMRKLRRFIRGEELQSFIDVGCGMGAVLFSLDKVNKYNAPPVPINKIHGIEVDEKYINVFEEVKDEMFNIPENVKIFNIDAFEFEKYDKYDFIFAYNPIASRTLYKSLVKQIWKEMKTGAYFFDPYNAFYQRWIPSEQYQISKKMKFTRKGQNSILKKIV